MFALATTLGMVAGAQANFEDDYQTGLKALDSGHLDEAKQFLRKALASQPGPVDKVKLNDNDWQPYLPYHFLGMVAYKQGDCVDADAQWSSATNKRMIGRLVQLRKQEQSLLASCQQKAVAQAKEEKSTSAQSTEPVASAEPAPAAPVTTAPANGAPATGTAKAPANALAKTDRSATAAGSDATKPSPDVNAPPPRLVQAFDNYLAGRYREVLRIDPETYVRPRAKFHAYLLRAASRFTLATIDANKAQLEEARADVRAAHALEPRVTPDAVMFSPRFRTFYTEAN